MRINNQPGTPSAKASLEGAHASWQPGSQYRALVTAVRCGNVDIQIGNRYLRATTTVPLTVGQTILLELQSANAESLVFRLLGMQGTSEKAISSNVLISAAGLAAAPGREQVRVLLTRNGIPATAMSLRQTSLLIDALGQQRAAAFLPELRAYLARGLELPDSVLLQIAHTATATSASDALAPYPEQRERRGQRARRRQRAPAPPLSLTDAGVGPAELRSGIATLLGAPEHAILTALIDHAGEPTATAQLDFPLGFGEPGANNRSTAEAMATWAEAQRVRAAADPQAIRFTLPLNMNGEEIALAWEQHDLGGDYYERESHLRLRLLSDTQGRVDILLHLRGTGLRVDVASESPDTASAYEQELPGLVLELQEMGFSISRATAARQVLPS